MPGTSRAEPALGLAGWWTRADPGSCGSKRAMPRSNANDAALADKPGDPSERIDTPGDAEAFYGEVLRRLSELGLPFLLAGTHAVAAHTGISRPTKDLDIFAKPGDAPRILNHFAGLGYHIEIEDERWLGKVRRGEHFFDVVFAAAAGTMPVSDEWFQYASETEAFGVPVQLVGPTELVWSKAFIQVRHRYDGADIAHVLLRRHDRVDWHRLLSYFEQHWEVLLMHLLNFRFIYPSERNVVPRWLMDELTSRLGEQLDLPPPQRKVCRGRMFSQVDYDIDVRHWGFADTSGEGDWRDG